MYKLFLVINPRPEGARGLSPKNKNNFFKGSLMLFFILFNHTFLVFLKYMTYHKSKLVFIFISIINLCFLCLITERIINVSNIVVEDISLYNGPTGPTADLNPTNLLIIYPILLFYEVIVNLFFIFK